MTGTVRGEAASHFLNGVRVLQGRFVELHIVDAGTPPAHEARVFIGVDSARSQYIAHWIDSFGAPFSIPHGTGGARGDTLSLAFPYPEGAFRDTFVYAREADTWHFRLESADSTGGWGLFAEYRVRRQ